MVDLNVKSENFLSGKNFKYFLGCLIFPIFSEKSWCQAWSKGVVCLVGMCASLYLIRGKAGLGCLGKCKIRFGPFFPTSRYLVNVGFYLESDTFGFIRPSYVS